MRPVHLLAAAAAALLCAPAAAGAETFRLVQATHVSTSEKTTDTYDGTSHVRWSLAPRARVLLDLQRVGAALSGGTQVAVRGTYAIDVAAGDARCALRAPTGSRRYPLVAPGPFMLAIGPDPDDARRTVLSFSAIQATLSTPYLGSECGTSVAGEPDQEVTAMAPVRPGVLRRRRFTVHLEGATSREGIRYRWRTAFAFERAGRGA